MLVVLCLQLWKPGVLLFGANLLYRPIYVSNICMKMQPHGIMQVFKILPGLLVIYHLDSKSATLLSTPKI